MAFGSGGRNALLLLNQNTKPKNTEILVIFVFFDCSGVESQIFIFTVRALYTNRIKQKGSCAHAPTRRPWPQAPPPGWAQTRPRSKPRPLPLQRDIHQRHAAPAQTPVRIEIPILARKGCQWSRSAAAEAPARVPASQMLIASCGEAAGQPRRPTLDACCRASRRRL